MALREPGAGQDLRWQVGVSVLGDMPNKASRAHAKLESCMSRCAAKSKLMHGMNHEVAMPSMTSNSTVKCVAYL